VIRGWRAEKLGEQRRQVVGADRGARPDPHRAGAGLPSMAAEVLVRSRIARRFCGGVPSRRRPRVGEMDLLAEHVEQGRAGGWPPALGSAPRSADLGEGSCSSGGSREIARGGRTAREDAELVQGDPARAGIHDKNLS